MQARNTNNPCDLNNWRMTLILNRFLAVVKVHTCSCKFHQVKCSGSWALVLTERQRWKQYYRRFHGQEKVFHCLSNAIRTLDRQIMHRIISYHIMLNMPKHLQNVTTTFVLFARNHGLINSNRGKLFVVDLEAHMGQRDRRTDRWTDELLNAAYQTAALR